MTQDRIDLTHEEFGKAVEVFDGFWIIATRHRPGLSQRMFEINNRALVFRLDEDGTPVLLVVNCVDPAVIPEVRRIEQETGLKVKYFVSPGGGHHLHIDPWHAEFTDAKFLVGPTRIPRTAHGKELVALPRVEVTALEDPIPGFAGQLDAIQFVGITSGVDVKSPGEGAPDTGFGMFRRMVKALMNMHDPYDELWIHHVASGTVVGGENLGWYFTAAEHAKLPFLFKPMVTPDAAYINAMARKVADAAEVKRCWEQILAWPAKAVISYHDVLTTGVVADDASAQLRQAVETVGQL